MWQRILSIARTRSLKYTFPAQDSILKEFCAGLASHAGPTEYRRVEQGITREISMATEIKATANTSWDGSNMSQEDFMMKDECILLDFDDKIIGHANKYESHIFCPTRPRAKLHRAFSVFLFNSEGKLLLQQRAADKITFPNVWTNTCCSHPLFGFEDTEVDTPEQVADGTVPGVKRAAVRKLQHELGIKPSQLNIDGFKFLTRLHYWAADVVTHGKSAPFGEHEIDYILFIQADVDVDSNPEEIRDHKYVTQEELRKMMDTESGLLWSPWFRIIAERFLSPWWSDLNATLCTDTHVDVNNIHRFDCTQEHMGGAGTAGAWLDEENASGTGDKWLAEVIANGGTAPSSEDMKPKLVKSTTSNTYSLQL